MQLLNLLNSKLQQFTAYRVNQRPSKAQCIAAIMLRKIMCTQRRLRTCFNASNITVIQLWGVKQMKSMILMQLVTLHPCNAVMIQTTTRLHLSADFMLCLGVSALQVRAVLLCILLVLVHLSQLILQMAFLHPPLHRSGRIKRGALIHQMRVTSHEG